MLCPKCKTEDKFKRVGKAVYCCVCFYTLKYNERKKFNKIQLKRSRKEYFKKYYHNKKKKYLPGVGLKEMAIIKKCSISTIKKHIKLFDVMPGYKPTRYELNDKFICWFPDQIIKIK